MVNEANLGSEAQAVVIARLQEQNSILFELARETRDELKRIRETFENGCVFGRVLRADFDELKAGMNGSGGVHTRIMNLEHTRTTWAAKWGGIVVTLLVLGNVIAWGLMVYEAVSKK